MLLSTGGNSRTLAVMASTMKAMVLERHGRIDSVPLRLFSVPVPQPGPHEVLVSISVCGICRTDLHVIEGELATRRLPIIPGHQAVGKVVVVGSACSRLKVGELVGIAWLRSACGECEYCAQQRENLCDRSSYTGYHENGGYAEFAVVPENFAYIIPEQFSDIDAAPLLCAGIIGYRALRRSNVPQGGKLGLFGFGSSAHITLQVALARNCEIFVVTRSEKHRVFAKRLGASWVGDLNDAVPAALDSAIVFAPVGSIVPQALRALKKGGTVATAGIYMTPLPEMDYESCLFHEKQLLSVESNTREDGADLLREAAEIPIRPLVQTFRFEDANKALLQLKSDGIEGTGVLML